MTGKMTMIGYQAYFAGMGDDLFRELVMPEGIDRDVIVNTILMRCGEFPVLYSNPLFTQVQIGLWSRKHQRTFEKWLDALAIKYDPLSNYDRQEEWTDTNTGVRDSSAHSSGESTGSGENKVSAYNSDAYENDATSNTQNGTSSDSTTHADDSNTAIHAGRVKGNIGVTTSQQMLQAELEIAKWNVYDQIADLFVIEFCIPVY